MTGTALHLFPLLTMWNIHWNLHGTVEREQWGFYNTDHIEFDLTFLATYFGYFMTFYSIWATLYYSILYIYWDQILENQYYCLLLNELIRGAYIKNIREKHGQFAAKVAFVLKHLFYTLTMSVTMAPAFFSKIY
jgi:hypothetical protein